MNYKLRKKKLYENAETNNSFEEDIVYAKQELNNGADRNDVFDVVENFSDGFAKVSLNGKWCMIDTNGNLYDENKNPINNVTEN